MKTHSCKSLLSVALISIVVFTISACGNSDNLSPEQRVKHTLSMIEEAAENRSMSDFMKHVADDYLDHKGHTKADIKKILQLHYLRNQNIHILSTIDSLSISDNTAAVELSAAMASSASALEGGFSSLRADTHKFSVVLRSRDQQQSWSVVSVSWQQGLR